MLRENVTQFEFLALAALLLFDTGNIFESKTFYLFHKHMKFNSCFPSDDFTALANGIGFSAIFLTFELSTKTLKH